MKHRSIAAWLAVIFNLSVLLVLGCGESYQARTVRLEKEFKDRKAAEINRLLSQYPSAVDFNKFAENFWDQYTVNLQDAIRNKPEQIYWIEVYLIDLVRRGDNMKVEFADSVVGTSMFSLNCPERVYSAITSDPKVTQIDTYFVFFTLKSVTSAQLELRSEQDGEVSSVTLDSSIGARVFTGEALEVRRVSDPEK